MSEHKHYKPHAFWEEAQAAIPPVVVSEPLSLQELLHPNPIIRWVSELSTSMTLDVFLPWMYSLSNRCDRIRTCVFRLPVWCTPIILRPQTLNIQFVQNLVGRLYRNIRHDCQHHCTKKISHLLSPIFKWTHTGYDPVTPRCERGVIPVSPMALLCFSGCEPNIIPLLKESFKYFDILFTEI